MIWCRGRRKSMCCKDAGQAFRVCVLVASRSLPRNGPIESHESRSPCQMYCEQSDVTVNNIGPGNPEGSDKIRFYFWWPPPPPPPQPQPLAPQPHHVRRDPSSSNSCCQPQQPLQRCRASQSVSHSHATISSHGLDTWRGER